MARGRSRLIVGLAAVAVLGGAAWMLAGSDEPSPTTTIITSTTITSTSTSSTTISVAGDPARPAPAEQPAPPATPATVGTVVLSFGEAGTGAGQLTGARALAVTPAGDIVIAEARTGRVQVFDAKGAYQRVITLPPSALTKELTVFGAAANDKGEVVVARAGDLLVLDVAGGKVARTIRGSYPEIFYHGDVEIVPDGSIYAITDRTGDLNAVHLSPVGKVLATLKNVGAEHLAVDGLGTMYLTRKYAGEIDVRDAKGGIVKRYSQGNPARGKLSHPGAIAIDGRGHVFVEEGTRVLVLDPEGAFLAELAVGPLEDLAVDRAGFLYVLAREKLTKYQLALPAR